MRSSAALRRWLASADVREAARIVVVTRGMLFLVGWLAALTFQNVSGHAGTPLDALVTLPGRWDAGWYLGIASGGYRWAPGHTNPRVAFFPGFPLTVRIAGSLLHLPDLEAPWLWTGVVLATIFFFLALVALQRLARALGHDAERAAMTAWLLACYPFSLFYGQHYSESLFLLCAVATCLAARRARWWTSVAFGVYLGLVRPTGVLVSAALIPDVIVWCRRHARAREWWPALAALAGPATGLLLYALYVWHISGDPLAWMHVQTNWGRAIGNPFAPFVRFAADGARNGLVATIGANPYDVLNGTAALFALAAVAPVARRVGIGFAAFVLLGVLVPLTDGGLLSLGRFTSVLFPIFLWLGAKRPARPGLLATMAMAQAFLAALFFTDRPIF